MNPFGAQLMDQLKDAGCDDSFAVGACVGKGALGGDVFQDNSI